MPARFSDRLSIRGAWSSSVAYQRGDVVTLSGQTWLALSASTNVTPAEGSTWTLSAAKGATGTSGSNGTAGASGVVSVNAPITNAGTSSAANLSLTTDTAAGVPTLDGSGLIRSSQLPAIAISDTNVVASEAAMLALTAQVGDVAVRSDLSKSFILKTTPASTLANWQELLSPPSSVLSVAGRTGAISLTNADVTGLGTAATKDYPASGNASSSQVVYGTDTRLTNGRPPDYVDLSWTTDANYTVVTTNSAIVQQTGTLTAARTVTLPAANALPAGSEVIIQVGASATATNTVTIQRAGSDTINGSTTSVVVGTSWGMRRFITDGSSAWVYDAGVLRISNNLSELTGTAATARTNLGLGALATKTTAAPTDLSIGTATTSGVTPSTTAAEKLVSAATTVSGTAISGSNKVLDAAAALTERSNGMLLYPWGNGVTAFSAATCRWQRFVPTRDLVVKRFGFEIRTASTNAESVDVGIYDASGNRLISTGPTTTIYTGPTNTGATSTTSAGYKYIVLNGATGYTLTAGSTYYAAIGITYTSGTAVTITVNSLYMAGIFGSSAGTADNASQSSLSTLPATMASVAYAGTVGPMIALIT